MRIIPWDEINGEQGHEKKMEAFLTKETDTFAILQLKEIDETEDLQFRSFAELKRMGIEPDPDHYEIVYTEPLPPFKEQEVFLENCFTRFNVDRPESFRGHSMSVSDIIAIRRAGEITAHYVESIGFVELNDFFSGKNYLRTVEDMLEQNDGMIDGVINNLPEDAKPEAHEKKASILEALKEEPAVGVITMKDTGEEGCVRRAFGKEATEDQGAEYRIRGDPFGEKGALRRIPQGTKSDAGVHHRPEECGNDSGDPSGEK